MKIIIYNFIYKEFFFIIFVNNVKILLKLWILYVVVYMNNYKLDNFVLRLILGKYINNVC